MKLRNRLLMGLIFFLLSSCGEYEEKEREVGYKGLAKINHLLAAERFAEKMGWEAESYRGVPSLPPPAGITLVLPAESLQSEGQLSQIEEWMQAGGHLVAFLSLQDEDALTLRSSENKQEVEPFQAFLDYFSFELVPHLERADDQDAAEEDYTWMRGRTITQTPFNDEEPYLVNFRSRYLLSDPDFPEQGARVFQSYDYGEGSLVVFTSLGWATNESLGKAEHAVFLRDVLGFDEMKSEIWFVHSTRLSFFKLLWKQFPLALILLMITLVLLVWWAARGFGPKFVRGTVPIARLDEHLEASGAFFLKHKGEALIIEQLRTRLRKKIARASNQPMNLNEGELFDAAEKQGVLVSVERDALTSVSTDKNLLSTLTTLKNLDKRL